MIGLVDYAVQASTSTTLLVPNIEIMKLATYYKVEENQFCRLIGLDETDLTPYDKIYFFCEDSSSFLITSACFLFVVLRALTACFKPLISARISSSSFFDINIFASYISQSIKDEFPPSSVL